MAYAPNNINGQATMANSAPVVLASNQSAVPVSGAFFQYASNNYSSITGLAAGATTTIVSITSSAVGYSIGGLSITGTGEGYFFIQVAGITVLSSRTTNTQRSNVISLPNPLAVSTGSAVVLRVTNEGGASSDYEATLFGS